MVFKSVPGGMAFILIIRETPANKALERERMFVYETEMYLLSRERKDNGNKEVKWQPKSQRLMVSYRIP